MSDYWMAGHLVQYLHTIGYRSDGYLLEMESGLLVIAISALSMFLISLLRGRMSMICVVQSEITATRIRNSGFWYLCLLSHICYSCVYVPFFPLILFLLWFMTNVSEWYIGCAGCVALCFPLAISGEANLVADLLAVISFLYCILVGILIFFWVFGCILNPDLAHVRLIRILLLHRSSFIFKFSTLTWATFWSFFLDFFGRRSGIEVWDGGQFFAETNKSLSKFTWKCMRLHLN